MHYLELLRDVVGFDKVKEAVVNPLTGKKIARILRLSAAASRQGPCSWTIPKIRRLWRILFRALGAEPVIYPQTKRMLRRLCRVLEDPASLPKRNPSAVLESARSHGADFIVTACPLCKYNLHEKWQR